MVASACTTFKPLVSAITTVGIGFDHNQWNRLFLKLCCDLLAHAAISIKDDVITHAHQRSLETGSLRRLKTRFCQPQNALDR